MTEANDKPEERSVWRGVARMEAELQDPEEDETFIYKSTEMAEMRKAAIAELSLPGAIPDDEDEVDEDAPTSRDQLKVERDEEPADKVALLDLDPFESTQDDNETAIGFAELLRVRKEHEERPPRSDKLEGKWDDDDESVALWANADDTGAGPRRGAQSDSAKKLLWGLVFVLVVVAIVIAINQGRFA